MRLSTSLLFCLSLVPFVAQGLGCGGEDPPTVPSTKRGKGGEAGENGSAGGAGAGASAGSTGAGAAGASGAGAGGAAAGAAGATTGAGAAGASGAGAGAAGATAGGAAGATAGGAAGAGTGGAGNGGAGGVVKKKGAGYVEVFAGKESASTFKNTGSARFIKAPAEGATSPCATTDLAGTNCKVETCTALPTGDISENAGLIDVQVNLPAGPESKMHLVWNEGSRSYSVQEANLPTNAAVFTGGQKLTLLASGYDAPGFNTETTAPGVLTLTSPAPGNVGQPIVIDTKADLPLTFSGSGNGALEIKIESSKKDNPTAYTKLICSFPAGASGAKIPTAVLSKLPLAEAASYNTSFRVLTVSSAPVDNLQTYEIAIRAATHVLDGSGNPWGPQQVTLK